MARVFVSRQLPGAALERLRKAHETTVWSERRPPTYEQLRAHAAEADGLLTMLSDRIDAPLLEAAPRLRAVANYAVGFDNVDLAAAARHGVAVGNTPDVLTEATADLAFALLLAAARRLPEALASARNDWSDWEPTGLLGAEVWGATLGVVGMGRIGRAVARRGEGFGMTVLGSSRGSGSSLEELLARADFVSLHVPLSADTHHLIDADALARMQPTAILINTARGEIVDQAALAAALHERRIAGAALDVTTPEPLSPDDPLWRAPNLVITPHIGSATRSARERMAELAVDNLLAGLDGQPMPNQVSVTREAPAA